MGNDPPVMGHNSGVMTDMGSVIEAVMESEPGSDGPRPLVVALVMAAPFKQWKVTLSVAPAITEPAGVPSFELSSEAWFAMVAIGPPPGGTAEVTVTAIGPLPVPAHTPSAALCWCDRLAVVEGPAEVGHSQREQQHDGQSDGGFHEGLAARPSYHLCRTTGSSRALLQAPSKLMAPRCERLRNLPS